jgi:hypothetical protein
MPTGGPEGTLAGVARWRGPGPAGAADPDSRAGVATRESRARSAHDARWSARTRIDSGRHACGCEGGRRCVH